MSRKNQEEGMAKCILKNASEGRGTMEDVITREKTSGSLTVFSHGHSPALRCEGKSAGKQGDLSKTHVPRTKALLRIHFSLEGGREPTAGFLLGGRGLIVRVSGRPSSPPLASRWSRNQRGDGGREALHQGEAQWLKWDRGGGDAREEADVRSVKLMGRLDRLRRKGKENVREDSEVPAWTKERMLVVFTERQRM